jgi:hypothetical protein
LPGYDPGKWDIETLLCELNSKGKLIWNREGVLEQARNWRMMRIVRIIEGFKGGS